MVATVAEEHVAAFVEQAVHVFVEVKK